MKTLVDFGPKHDPIYGGSGYDRERLDRYWTEPWITSTLLNQWGLPSGRVWEPAAGRGDIVGVLQDFGCETFASDVDMSEYIGPDPCEEFDFRVPGKLNLATSNEINVVITNPPYKGEIADQFVNRAIDLLETNQIEMAAFLLRAEWKHAKKRASSFDHTFYAGEIVLRKRPRWDWWYSDTPQAAPRHNFSWFIWDRRDTRTPVQLFQKVT